VKKGDKRKVSQVLTLRTAVGITKVPVGEVVEIQQVDEAHRNVLVESVWVYAGDIEKRTVPFEESPLDRPLTFGDAAQINEIKRREAEPGVLLLTEKDIGRILAWFESYQCSQGATFDEEELAERLEAELE
jgi:hypothetical protein